MSPHSTRFIRTDLTTLDFRLPIHSLEQVKQQLNLVGVDIAGKVWERKKYLKQELDGNVKWMDILLITFLLQVDLELVD